MRQIPTAFKFVLLAGGLMFSLMYASRSSLVVKLEKESDSLRTLVLEKEKLVTDMRSATSWTDSIISNLDMNPAAAKNELPARLQSANQAIKANKKRIDEMANAIHIAKQHHEGYLAVVEALQGEVSDRVEESEVLMDSIEYFAAVNIELYENVSMQEDAMTGLYEQLQDRQLKLDALERRAHQLKEMTEAEIYYVKGQQAEENGNRIRLAPQRKKETYREALELYKKSYSLGKSEASLKISFMEKVLSLPQSLVVGNAARHSDSGIQ